METQPLTIEQFIRVGMDKTCSYEHYIYLFNLRKNDKR